MTRMVLVLLGTALVCIAHGLFLDNAPFLPIFLSMLLVLFGPLFSIALAHPWPSLRKLWQEILAPGSRRGRELAVIEEIRKVARVWQVAGRKDLERVNRGIDNPFLRKGVEMLIDGYGGPDIKRILERNFEIHLSAREARANILASLIKLTQSFGFIGTVIGLISVLGSLHNTAEIGSGVSLALFTTLYGLLLSNLVYIPAHKKYIEALRAEYNLFPIVAEGIQGITNRESSKYLCYKLNFCFDLEETGRMERGGAESVSPAPGLAGMLAGSN